MSYARPASREGPLPLLDTEVLRSFVAIADSGSFTRAAHEVFRTPSAVSMQIKRLEATLGATLFVRQARQVNLTPEGELLLSYGRRMLKLNEETVSRFLAPTLDGTVRLGTPDDVGTRILPDVLTQFARSHPAVQVDVMTGGSADLRDRLDAGELDLVLITVGNQDVDSERGTIVHTEPLVWAGLRGGVARQRSPLPVAVANHGCAWRTMALAALDRADRPYRIAYTSEHCAGQRAALQADLAIAPFPLSLVHGSLQELDGSTGLAPIGDYQVAMIQKNGASAVSEILSRHVVEAFRAIRR